MASHDLKEKWLNTKEIKADIVDLFLKYAISAPCLLREAPCQ